MKMFKKIAATVMAAAMSLAMLTACGGGGGGSTTQYKMAKVLAESQKTGKVFMDVNVEVNGNEIRGTSAVDSKSGKNAALFGSTSGNIYYGGMTTKDGKAYTLDYKGDQETQVMNPADFFWKKVGSVGSEMAVASASVPSASDISKMQIKPEYEYNGEKYYAEVLSANGVEVAYCFDIGGDTLKYVIVKVQGQEFVEKVNAISGQFPDKISDTIPMSYDDLLNLPTVD